MRIDTKILIAYIVLVILSLLMFSCTAKKDTVERTRISDTLITTSLQWKSEPIKTSYQVDLECDTITGEVKPVKSFESSGQNKSKIEVKDGMLNIDLQTGSSQTKIDTIYISKDSDKFESSEIVRYKTPLWHWFAHVIGLFFVVLFVKRFF